MAAPQPRPVTSATRTLRQPITHFPCRRKTRLLSNNGLYYPFIASPFSQVPVHAVYLTNQPLVFHVLFAQWNCAVCIADLLTLVYWFSVTPSSFLVLTGNIVLGIYIDIHKYTLLCLIWGHRAGATHTTQQPHHTPTTHDRLGSPILISIHRLWTRRSRERNRSRLETIINREIVDFVGLLIAARSSLICRPTPFNINNNSAPPCHPHIPPRPAQ